MAKTIAVDFDGVIHAYSKGWQDGSIYDGPLPGAIDGIEELARHAAVFIHTTRESRSVVDWLATHQIVALTEADALAEGWEGTFWNDQTRVLVTSRKLPAVAYLDDRGVRFSSWPHALRDLSRVLQGHAP